MTKLQDRMQEAKNYALLTDPVDDDTIITQLDGVLHYLLVKCDFSPYSSYVTAVLKAQERISNDRND